MSGLVLLASYPKSGNTWMRAFLSSLACNGRTPDINHELQTQSLTWRDDCDSLIGIETSDLTSVEIALIRPYIARRAATLAKGFVKVHDANLAPPGGHEPAYPADSVDRVLYIVRDPRDVALSCVHHFGKAIDAIVGDLNDPEFSVGRSDRGLTNNVRQYISTWSIHVESWLDAADISVHAVRYEDMIAKPMQTFSAAAAFLNVESDPELISRAIEATSFQKLAGEERRSGFRETSPLADTPFFRRGAAGEWRAGLSAALAQRIVRDHGSVMRRLGYLNAMASSDRVA